ncbi:nucleotidyltransferase family protein [Mesorhizobium sp. CA8]|uniref:nucleotidyltransferase family protein n=1 Tax=unclassified Mesorhizobium TaxID=325217 RepID=UPI001CC92F4A|nr:MULTISPECIES: nucleotidyltransferase family protein [unclassified Mesorhizobium]MBZ9760462.1 nucleotidyltransferase family protein [Mesorhizobium sp. CA8]MBZ9821102.1 nucleotidyltransferase family protein [Mesorhizobium sp. CA4]
MLPSLAPADEKLLLTFADPEAPAAVGRDVAAKTLLALLVNAQFHGVLPIMLRKLREIGGARLPQDPTLQRRLSELRDEATMATGQSMLLQYHGDRIMKALAAKGVPARIVKGPVFARKLYSQVADRPFTDIDILVDPASIEAANRTIGECGFELGSDEPRSHELQEFKWLEKENSSLLVELHGNLVHDTGMRRRLSLGFRELQAIDGSETDTPAALLTIAIVHAAGGHKFHRLQLCVDVLQGVRALKSPQAEARLLDAARMTGIELELATVLNVTGRLFAAPRAIELADRIKPDLSIRLAKWLITGNMLLRVNSREKLRSRLSRDAFRWVQRLARPRPYPA